MFLDAPEILFVEIIFGLISLIVIRNLEYNNLIEHDSWYFDNDLNN